MVLAALFKVPRYLVRLFLALLSRTLSLLPGWSSLVSSARKDTAHIRFASLLRDCLGSSDCSRLDWVQSTYTAALNTAKRESRVMLVYLHASNHDDSLPFLKEYLNTPAVASFLQEHNLLLWGGNVSESEAYQVSQTLSVSKYPFLAIIAESRSQMRVQDRVQGLPKSLASFLSRLDQTISRLSPELISLRSDRLEREAARRIRQQQDDAYEASLAADREKEATLRRDREELTKREKEVERREKAKQLRANERRALIASIRDSMPQEPPAGSKDCTKISIRLPNGDRIVRVFRADDKILLLRNFIMSQENLAVESEYEICSTFPRRVFTDDGLTIRDAGLFPSGSVVVEDQPWSDEGC
ncbi:MAG: hypothetical protein SGCHY_004989 [Lobulomycetales sp.]